MIASLLPLLLVSPALAGVLLGTAEDATTHYQKRGAEQPERLHSFAERAFPGPISTGSPAGVAGGNVACSLPPVSSFFAGLKPPFPTNTWWASYAADPGKSVASGPFPYESQLDGYGVGFGISTDRQFDGVSVKQPTQIDWRASFSEHGGAFGNHKATAFDSQTVTIQYFDGSSSMTTYLVPGSPYMTFKYNAATPLLKSMNGGIRSFNGNSVSVGGSSTATGTKFTVVDSKGSTYLIYALSSITLKATSDSDSSGTIRASGTYNGVLRLVMLSKEGHRALLDQYSSNYPTAAGLDWSISGNTATLIFNWDTVGSGDLLLLTWPHHRLTMQSPNFPSTSSLGYLTTKGWMYPAIGKRWSMNYQLSNIVWDPPRGLDSSCRSIVEQGLEYEVGQLDPSKAPVPGDFYYWGGTLAAVSRLALIANHIGRNDLVNPVINYLKASFEHWFSSSSSTVPAYETTWGGIVNKAGATNVYVDFGNGYYNDHHFHYGYFLNVAAVIGKFDGNWLNAHRDYINLFARDIINPSTNDPYFPVARCRDWFAGHSWASGIANGAGSRDQESSGEAINGYYGALLWASVALSQDFVNFSKLLLATEQHGAKVYWHLYPQMGENDRDNPYPEPGMRRLITMGNVEDWQAGAWLFWGNQKSQIAAIQMLPVTPINEILYDTQWVDNMWSYAQDELNNPGIGDEWKSVMIDAYSNAHPQTAAEWSSRLTTWGSGHTFTNEIYFIGTRPSPSGSPICGTMPQNPKGNFKIQAANSGNYVVASSSNTNLVASTSSSSSAAVFKSAWTPNAGTIQLISTSQYVTADQGGTSALAAVRGSASSWERFTIRPKVGAGSGVYSIKAASNGLYVTVAGDGSLVNNGKAESDSTGFRFIAS